VVTATRRPKDTKLPHRPAFSGRPFVLLTFPKVGGDRGSIPTRTGPDPRLTPRSTGRDAPGSRVERGVTPGTGVVVGLPLAVTGRSPVARGTLSLAARGTLRLSVAVEVLARAVSVARKRRTAPPARRTGHGATARPRGRSRRRGASQGVIRLTATEPERDHVDGVVPVGTARLGSTATPGAGPRTGRQSRARSSCAGRQ